LRDLKDALREVGNFEDTGIDKVVEKKMQAYSAKSEDLRLKDLSEQVLALGNGAVKKERVGMSSGSPLAKELFKKKEIRDLKKNYDFDKDKYRTKDDSDLYRSTKDKYKSDAFKKAHRENESKKERLSQEEPVKKVSLSD